MFCSHVVKSILFSSVVFLSQVSFAGELIVFGDSINDTGNLESVLVAQGAGFPPETFGGRVSNGLVTVEVAAKLAGQELKPALFPLGQAAGGNYAFAGARARMADEQPIHLSQQVGAFLLAKQGVADVNNTYIIYIGGNDVLDAYRLNESSDGLYKRGKKHAVCGRRINRHSDENGILKAAVAAIDENIQKLIDAGAKKIVVANAFDISDVPEIKTVANKKQSFKASFLSCQFNKRLAKRIKHFNKHNYFKIVSFDFNRAGKNILKNSQAFGFTNTTQGCLSRDGFAYNSTSFCNLQTDIDGFLFFDELHFSAFGHEYLGRALYSILPR